MTDLNRRAVLVGSGAAGLLVAAGGAMSEADAAARPTLRVGSTGSYVTSAQRTLWACGYWCGGADGHFGSLMQQAVWAVQKAHGISRTGIVDAATWKAIDSRYRMRPRHAGTHVEIDKSRQLLLVVRGGRTHVALNTSTGSGRTFIYQGRRITARTPSGTFHFNRQSLSGWVYGSLGGLYKPVYFNGGIAVHGSTNIPPYADSHGCCRLSTSAQNFLLADRDLRLGTTVYVY